LETFTLANDSLTIAVSDFNQSSASCAEISTHSIPSVPQVSTVSNPSPTSMYAITLLLGIIPRCGSYELSPTATLAEAEVMVKQRFNLGALELEFGLCDIATDDTSIVEKSRMISSLDLSHFVLVVRPSQTFAVPLDRSSGDHDGGSSGASRNRADASGSLIESLHITCGSVLSTDPAYVFVCEQRSEEFRLHFPIGSKVADARETIGRHYRTPSNSVSLHFLGKALRDGFVMDRLCLGESKINVFLQDDTEVVLVTAKANRQTK
jgi:hypothetical protein